MSFPSCRKIHAKVHLGIVCFFLLILRKRNRIYITCSLCLVRYSAWRSNIWSLYTCIEDTCKFVVPELNDAITVTGVIFVFIHHLLSMRTILLRLVSQALLAIKLDFGHRPVRSIWEGLRLTVDRWLTQKPGTVESVPVVRKCISSVFYWAREGSLSTWILFTAVCELDGSTYWYICTVRMRIRN